MKDWSVSLLGAGSFGRARRLPKRNLPGPNQWRKSGCGDQLRAQVYVDTDLRKLVREQPFEPFRYPALLLSFWSGVRREFGANHGA